MEGTTASDTTSVDPERRESKDTIYSTLFEQFRFILKIAVYGSLTGSLGPAFSAVWVFVATKHEFTFESNLPFFKTEYPGEIILRNTTVRGRVLQIVALTPSHHMVFVGFFPLVLWFYLGRESLPLKATACSLLAYFAFFFTGFGVAGIGAIYLTNLVYAILFFAIALKIALPSLSKIPYLVFYHMGCIVLPTFLALAVMPYFPMHNNLYQLIYYCVLLPVLREISRFLGSRSAWLLSSDAQVNISAATKPNRHYGWTFLGYNQILWALFFRLSIVNTTNSSMTFFVIAYQAILEIVLRLTVQQRDTALGRIMSRVRFTASKPQRKRTDISPDLNTGFDISALTHREYQPSDAKGTRQQARAVFYSVVIMIEMMAEYSAIVTSQFLITFWYQKPLMRPFPWYVQAQVFESIDFDYEWVISLALLQLGAEILVDFVCITRERTISPLKIWPWVSQNKAAFAILYIAVSWYGSILAVAIFNNRDSFMACQDSNICYCVNNGLTQGGVYDYYCRLIYPAAEWEKSPPVLGPHVSNLTSHQSSNP